MGILVIANQHAGPLPIKLSFDAPSDGPACLVVSGSAWTGTANQMIGVEVSIDGVAVGRASIFSNHASTHRAVVPTYIPVKLTIGAHTLELSPSTSATVTDFNDLFDAVLDY